MLVVMLMGCLVLFLLVLAVIEDDMVGHTCCPCSDCERERQRIKSLTRKKVGYGGQGEKR